MSMGISSCSALMTRDDYITEMIKKNYTAYTCLSHQALQFAVSQMAAMLCVWEGIYGLSFPWGELSCSALPAARSFLVFPRGEWRIMCYRKTYRNHNNLNCERIFRAKCQLSLIPLNRTAALLEQLNLPLVMHQTQ